MSILTTLHAERGITLVVVTHDANIASHCTRIIHVKDGEIVTEENA
jgi:putative ABC transport system ATP-binding protein